MKTASQIFELNQVLTLEIAKTMIGKTISVTSPEYRGNAPSVRTGTITGIRSEWELAGDEDFTHSDGGKYATRQEYWKSFMGDIAIAEAKNRLKIVADSELYATCDLKDKSSFAEPTFFGSDSDREIYYAVLLPLDHKPSNF